MISTRGSSPRVRGTLSVSPARRPRTRIIPACAGNSSGVRISGKRRPDHPRVCGELAMRDRRPSITADHPRVCGELSSVVTTTKGVVGSSPRVRGTLDPRSGQYDPVRIIPACAGNSLRASPRIVSFPDHPRVCGEL